MNAWTCARVHGLRPRKRYLSSLTSPQSVHASSLIVLLNRKASADRMSWRYVGYPKFASGTLYIRHSTRYDGTDLAATTPRSSISYRSRLSTLVMRLYRPPVLSFFATPFAYCCFGQLTIRSP